MTTYTNFTPNQSTPFTFQPTLDGNTYTVIVKWNLARGGKGTQGETGWYVFVNTTNNVNIVTLPLIGSDIGQEIETLTDVLGVITVTTPVPHGYKLGATVNLTISGATPDAYNGVWQMYVETPDTLSFSMPSDPGTDATVPGVLSYDIDLLAGYFNSTMVFRLPSQQFEVTP